MTLALQYSDLGSSAIRLIRQFNNSTHRIRMAGRRSADVYTKWVQIATVLLALIFVIVVGIGLNRMFNEIKVITKGQQALILNLAQKNTQQTKKVVTKEKAADQCISKVTFIKYQNETNRDIKDLEKKLGLLRQRVRAMKNPL